MTHAGRPQSIDGLSAYGEFFNTIGAFRPDPTRRNGAGWVRRSRVSERQLSTITPSKAAVPLPAMTDSCTAANCQAGPFPRSVSMYLPVECPFNKFYRINCRLALALTRWHLYSTKSFDQLCPSNSHSTGTSAGAPLSLIKNTRNFAGLVPLAFRSTT